MGLPISGEEWGTWIPLRIAPTIAIISRLYHISRLYPDYIQIISRLYPGYIQIISRLYPDYIPIDGYISTPDVPLYHDFWCQTTRPPSGGPGSAGSTSAGSGRAVGHFPPAHAEGVRPRSGNFDENCLGAPWTTKRYSNLQW